MKLVFTTLARQDLGRLRQFIAEHDPTAAARAAERIKATAQLIAEHPLIGRAVRSPDGVLREDVREIPLPFGASGYLIRYQVLPDRVRILRVWHSKEERENSAFKS